MDKKQVRLVMPEALYNKLRRFSAGNQTRFILDAIQERVRKLERETLERQLEEGYRVRSSERLAWAESTVVLASEILPQSRASKRRGKHETR